MRKVDFNSIQGVDDIAKNFYSDANFINKLIGMSISLKAGKILKYLTQEERHENGLEVISNIIDAQDQKSFYKELRIPKKNKKRRGEFRVVYRGDPSLKQLQKNIAFAIEEKTIFPICVQGFVKKRSTTTNAKFHLGKQLILNADIKDFFDSITIDQVIKIFMQLGCNQSVAEILAKICTINGVLRQGLHTSPILANIVAFPIDESFEALAEKYKCIYTRYGDDITLSSDDQLPTKDEVQDILKKHGFLLNESKFSITKRGQAQFVTGLAVFDKEYPRVPKRFKKWLRLTSYYMNKYGVDNHLERIGVPDFALSAYFNRIKGTIDYINASEPDLAKRIQATIPIDFAMKDCETLTQ